MSMLAEPRRRQKWCLNPRGAAWAADDNKFGQKLMEKMGWSKGKGLGREEQGNPQHISVKYKNNSKGIGYKGKDDEWIKHYEDFESVLASLNSEHSSTANSKTNSAGNSDKETEEKDKQKSLEARSKVSRARVHYHKFTRGKDLSRYSEDDIACILGNVRSKKPSEAEDEIGNVDNINCITTIKSCNSKDYFAQKMAKLKKPLIADLQAKGIEREDEEERKEDSDDNIQINIRKSSDEEVKETGESYQIITQQELSSEAKESFSPKFKKSKKCKKSHHSEDIARKHKSKKKVKFLQDEDVCQYSKELNEESGKIIKKKKISKKRDINEEEIQKTANSISNKVNDVHCKEKNSETIVEESVDDTEVTDLKDTTNVSADLHQLKETVKGKKKKGKKMKRIFVDAEPESCLNNHKETKSEKHKKKKLHDKHDNTDVCPGSKHTNRLERGVVSFSDSDTALEPLDRRCKNRSENIKDIISKINVTNKIFNKCVNDFIGELGNEQIHNLKDLKRSKSQDCMDTYTKAKTAKLGGCNTGDNLANGTTLPHLEGQISKNEQESGLPNTEDKTEEDGNKCDWNENVGNYEELREQQGNNVEMSWRNNKCKLKMPKRKLSDEEILEVAQAFKGANLMQCKGYNTKKIKLIC
ncbi:hypothetical protein OTU49_000071 [Cherax quadricarinatus]|uniref:G-patch domain-containing protein n=1 Tax=Cherax quadricarinatus TaxID=27406 RepID=A0AAW0Y398_CHEQU|nr:G patch domain-containing protein 4-like isoform X2 [Cherax quadricarinatus]